MNERTQFQPKTETPSFSPLPSLARRTSLLQRKCACGGTPGVDGECDQCRKRRLQRRASNNHAKPETAPPIVHETLSSPGQPLEAGTRAFMEFRFGHDFSQVRVHSDSKAAASAQAVNAMAYTVGRDVVFGAEQYRPQTSEGTRLLAHELAHVVHQSQAPGVLPIRSTYSNAGDAAEKEADVAAGKVLASNGPVAISQRFPTLIQRKCDVGTPKDCADYEHWLDTFPSKSPVAGDADITAAMPKDLQGLVTGKLSNRGGLPDCADIALTLRHYYLMARGQSTTFKVGRTAADATTFTIGKGATQKELRACLISTGTASFQETRRGFGLVNFYRKGGKNENITNLKELIAAGLKPGDVLVWKRRVAATTFQGHAQTVQAIKHPTFLEFFGPRTITPGTITIVQGNMEQGMGVGQLQQRLYTFTDLTDREDGDADIKDKPEESFFGAGPWK